MVFLTDFETGFFINSFESIAHILTVLVVAASAICVLFAMFVKTDNINPFPRGSFYFGLINLLLGFSQISELFLESNQAQTIPVVIALLKSLSILASGIVFCYFGLSYIAKNEVNYHYICLPIIAWILRLITTFISFSGMSNISDNLYDILMLSSVLVFLLYSGKGLCQIKSNLSGKIMLCAATISVVTSSVAILPKILTTLLGLQTFPHRHMGSPLTAFFMLIYIASYLCNITFKREENQ